MKYKELEIEIKDNLAWITLNRPPLNTLTIEFMEEIIAAHKSLDKKAEVWGVILSANSEKFFCNGLDPEYMLARDVKGRMKIFDVLVKMIETIYSFSKPELTLINGHAMAGGAIISVLTDYRFMAEGKARFSFSEVPVGLTIPRYLINIIESVCGPQNLVNATMIGKAYRTEEALQANLVDQIIAPEALKEEGEKFMRGLFALPQASMKSVKASIRKPYLKTLKKEKKQGLKQFRKFLTGNFDEGLLAVKEKRKPQFMNP